VFRQQKHQSESTNRIISLVVATGKLTRRPSPK
jgi:hypothetical protein